jgi:hypothetical protein
MWQHIGLGVAIQVAKAPKIDIVVMHMAAYRPWELPYRQLRHQK